MKTYEVELIKTVYLDTQVQANDEDEAIDKAYADLCIEDHEINLWEVHSCEEISCT